MKPISIVACSVLKQEVEEILKEDFPGLEAVFLDSRLHMHPERLHQVLQKTLEDRSDQASLLVYGDCHPYTRDMDHCADCCRTACVNCADLLLGRERYAEFRKAKTFLFLPEWTLRWREIFCEEMGFNDPELARLFMRENQQTLAYLDTGIVPVPTPALDEISSFFDMPIRVETVSLDPLRKSIKQSLEQLSEEMTHDQ